MHLIVDCYLIIDNGNKKIQGYPLMLKFKAILAILFFVVLFPRVLLASDINENDSITFVTMPHQQSQWRFGLSALYLESSSDDFHYATTLSQSEGVSPILAMLHFHFLTPEFKWGGIVDATYQFSGPGRFIYFAWQHLASTESKTPSQTMANSVTVGPAFYQTDVSEPPYPFIPGGALNVNEWDSITGQSKSEYNAVDIVFGQQIQFARLFELTPFVGLRYASINSHESVNAYTYDSDATVTPDTASGYLKLEDDYKGIGPRLGFRYQVKFNEYFALVGSFATSLLIGEGNQKDVASISYFTEGIMQEPSFNAVSKKSSFSKVVPEIDARLGLALNNDFGTDVGYGIELGLLAESYLRARSISQLSYYDTSRHDNDVNYYGPYLRIEFRIT